jgi:hypothetical protein
VSKSKIARIASPDTVTNAIMNDPDMIARRLRRIAQALYDDVGEALAGCDRSDDIYPYFEIMLDAIRTEAARLDAHSAQLGKAVA